MWAVLCGYFWPVVFENQVLLPYDLLYTIEPWRSEMADIAASRGLQGVRNIQSADALLGSLPLAQTAQKQLFQGHIPLWNPDTLTGFPTGAFFSPYPFQYVALWLWPADQALSKLVVFHALLLSLFAYLLVVALDAHKLAGLAAGLVAVLNGMVIFHLIAPGMLPATAWALSPFWLFVLFMKECRWRWSIAAGLCYGMFMLAGNVQLPIYASLSYGVYIAYMVGRELWRGDRRRAGAYIAHSALMVLIGLVISSPYLLINIVLVGDVNRGSQPAAALTKAAWWLRLIVPNYWGDITTANLTPGISFTTRVYVGIAPLVLAIVGTVFAVRKIEARILMLLAASFIGVTLLLPPFSTLFYLVFPPTFVLDHARTLIVSSLFLAVCAGLGLDALIRQRAAWLLALGLLGVLICALAALLLNSLAQPSLANTIPTTSFRIQAIEFSLASAVIALVVLLIWRTRFRRLSQAGLVGAIVLDLCTVFWRYQPMFPSDLMAPSPLIQRLAAYVYQSPVAPARTYQLGIDGPMSHLLDYFGIPEIGGYSSLPFARYNLYTFASGARLNTGEKYWNLVMAVTKHRSRLFDALGAQYLLVPRDAVLERDTRKAAFPELAREPMRLSAETVLVVPGSAASETIARTIHVPANGRSFLITGMALQTGSVEYTVLINGSVVETNILNQSHAIPYWRTLTVNLTPYAGQAVLAEFRAKPASGAVWGWVDPNLHYNPDGSALVLLEAGGLLLYDNTQAFPRIWVVHETVTVAPGDLSAAAAKVADPTIDLRRKAVVETEQPLALGKAQPTDRAAITHYEPTSVVVDVDVGQEGLLVLPDVYQNQWQANLDGQPTRVYATNLAMRGVRVPAGKHRVEFYYDQRNINLALTIAAVAGAGCVLALASIWLYDRRSPPRQRPPSVGTVDYTDM
jgi:hypothetical protein